MVSLANPNVAIERKNGLSSFSPEKKPVSAAFPDIESSTNRPASQVVSLKLS